MPKKVTDGAKNSEKINISPYVLEDYTSTGKSTREGGLS